MHFKNIYFVSNRIPYNCFTCVCKENTLSIARVVDWLVGMQAIICSQKNALLEVEGFC